MTRFLFVALACLSCIRVARAEQSSNSTADGRDRIQVSAGYLYQSSQTTFGSSNFGLNGGYADVRFPVLHRMEGVAQFSGVHSGSIPSAGTGLTLFTYTAGPRYSLPLRRREAGGLSAFAQVLFGGAHASEGLFPSGGAVNSSGNGFAMSAGGGLQLGLNQRVSLRVLQADYLYTRFANLFDNNQSSFRIGAGVTLRLR